MNRMLSSLAHSVEGFSSHDSMDSGKLGTIGHDKERLTEAEIANVGTRGRLIQPFCKFAQERHDIQFSVVADDRQALFKLALCAGFDPPSVLAN